MRTRQEEAMLERLKKTLVNGVDQYLTQDNPPPKEGSVFYYLKQASGATGRTRAQKYKEIIAESTDGQALIDQVINDVLGQNDNLGNSKLLRIRLAAAVCDYYKINYTNINQEVMRSIRNSIPSGGMGVPVLGPPIDVNAIKLGIYQEKIAEFIVRNNKDQHTKLKTNSMK